MSRNRRTEITKNQTNSLEFPLELYRHSYVLGAVFYNAGRIKYVKIRIL